MLGYFHPNKREATEYLEGFQDKEAPVGTQVRNLRFQDQNLPISLSTWFIFLPLPKLYLYYDLFIKCTEKIRTDQLLTNP